MAARSLAYKRRDRNTPNAPKSWESAISRVGSGATTGSGTPGLFHGYVENQSRRPDALGDLNLIVCVDLPHVDLAVGQDGNHALADADEHELTALRAVDSPSFDAGKVGWFSPGVWKVRINTDLQMDAVLL